MNFLLNPNVAYLILVGAILLTILAVFAPGSGVLEISALFAIFLAGYTVFNLPINPWALVLLLLGVVPFIIAVRRSHRIVFLGVSLAAMSVGSAFLFRTESGAPAVSPWLALLVTLITVPLVWIVVRKALDALDLRPSQDLDRLIGAVGEARTPIIPEGTVYVGGENWSAHSSQPIPRSAQVRVLHREGLVLEVEPLSAEESNPGP